MAMNLITLDFETYWSSKDYTLSKMGPIEYIRDPRFAVQMVGIRVNRGDVQVFHTPDSIKAVLYSLALEYHDRLVVAHNLNGFDALILSEIYGIKPYWMFDTIAAARWVGITRCTGESHAAVTRFLGTGEKTAGTVISDGKQWPHDFSEQDRRDFIRYCHDDVLQCSENMYKMLAYCTPDSLRFASLTARMATEPAFLLDRNLLAQYIDELDHRADIARQDISDLFRFQTKEEFLAAIRSADKFCHMLRILGQEPPMKFSAKKTETARSKLEEELYSYRRQYSSPPHPRQVELENILAYPDNYAVMTPALAKNDLEFLDLLEHPDPRVALLVQTRLANNSSIERSRAERFLALAHTGKALPIMLNAFKAHTSRYTAGNSEGATDGTQMQNIRKRGASQLTLRRSIYIPPGHKGSAADSSQVEARMLAFLACQDDLTGAFSRGECTYSQMAEKIFGVPWQEIYAGYKAGNKQMIMWRNIGKTCILSAGYQVGKKKFSDTLLRSGIKLHADLDKHRELAYQAWQIYRASNSAIVAFWDRCMQVVAHMEQGGSGFFAGPRDRMFEYGMMPVPGGVPVPSVRMPSGFIMRYLNLRVETNEYGRPEYFYDRPRGRNLVKTRIYGGSFCENLTQGLAFQLLMWQACRMDEDGIPLKGNNHDAWIAVVPESAADSTWQRMMYWMSQVPPWLEGFPVACGGEIGDDYTIA